MVLHLIKEKLGLGRGTVPTRDFIERALRVHIPPLEKVTFKVKEEDTYIYDVGNISTTGLGLILPKKNKEGIVVASSDRPVKGAAFKGEIVIESVPYILEVCVRHVTESLIGCSFENLDPKHAEAIRRYLEFKVLAISLVSVDQKYLQPHALGIPHWYTDGASNELFFVTQGERVVHFHMSFLGHYCEFDEESGVQFGNLMVEAERDKAFYKSSDIVEFHNLIAKDVKRGARLMIMNIEKITENHRSQLLDCFPGE